MWPGSILGYCGSVGMLLVICLSCGIIEFLTCLPFGELGTVVPKSGSIYIYLLTAFKHFHPFFGQLPAFIYLWLTYAIISPCYYAVCSFLLTDYLYVILKLFLSEKLLGTDEAAAKNVIGALVIVLVGAMNCVSVKIYMKSQNCLTYFILGSIVFMIGCGVYLKLTGQALGFNPTFEGTNWSVSALIQSLYMGLFAYDGGWMITGITEELKNPERNITYSILITLAITTATFTLLNLTFLTAFTPAEISNSTTVISSFVMKLFGERGAFISAVFSCICLATNIMSGMFYTSRVGYMGAKEGHMMKILCYLHKTQQTPVPAVVLQVVLTLIYFFIGGDIQVLVNMYNFCAWISYAVMMITIFIFRKQMPEANRPFRVPSVIPVLVTLLCITLVIFSLTVIALSQFIVFLIYILLITSVYYVFVFKAYRIKNFNLIQKKCEQLFSLVPPTTEEEF